jgi:hypothetical protein
MHEDDGMMGQFLVLKGTTGIDPAILDTSRTLVYPNPADDLLTVDFGKEVSTDFFIFNMFGQEMIKVKNNGSSIVTIDVSQLPVGMYFITSEKPNQINHCRFIVSR